MMKAVTIVLGLTIAAASAMPAIAANARPPIPKIDRRVDKSDDRVEQLNQQQLDSLRGQTSGIQQPGIMGAPLMQQEVPLTGPR